MGYNIEQRLAPKSVWFTPDEARNYYGRYARDGITIHWWGDGTGADNHDNIVNYFLRRTDGSVNYVLSDSKITMMVAPENVAWTSQSGNATTISIEHQPTLGDEGYKKSGWLVWQLEQLYGRKLRLYPHNYWWQTACPGTISLDRIRQEADKWARGEYSPAPAPTPTPPSSAQLEWSSIPTRKYRAKKQPTTLWRFDVTSWSAFTPVKQFNAGEEIEIYGQCVNKTLGATYYVTKYSYDKKIPNGFNVVDLELIEQPTPPPIPTPTPPPVTDPEWVGNLKDVADTKYWLKEDAQLWDIANNKPAEGKFAKSFKKNDEFVAGAITAARGTEYRVTQYSFDKKFYNGLPIDKLTLTPPTVPDVPPTPQIPPEPTEPPAEDSQQPPETDISWIRRALEAILKLLGIKI
jgi:hypothetical protein